MLRLWIITLAISFNKVWSARFSQEPSDQQVVLGGRAVLSCLLFNYTGIVQWTKDGLALGVGEGLRAWPRYRVLRVVDVGQYNLEISSADLSDDSLYECQATEAALRSRRAKLTVLIPPDDPVIEGSPEVLLTAGVQYNLSCVTRGAKPLAHIAWTRDGVPLEGAHVSTEALPDRKRMTTRSFLPIVPGDVDTGRNFTCVATNPAAPQGKRAAVTLNVHHPPTVTLSIEPRSVLEGERVTFTCKAHANPPIMGYRWAKGGVLLEGAREGSLTTTADHSFFTEPVSCDVFNAVGHTNVSALVDVHFGPILLVEPRAEVVDVDSDVTLNCKWSGNPPLTLTWTRKGSSMVLSNNNQLYLKSVGQGDAGQYVCKAIVPRIGVGETEVTLTVNGPPIISSDAVQYAVRGEKGEVKCYIASTPPPDKIVWAWKENVWEKERGTLLERYTVEQSKPLPLGGAVLSTLTINSVMETDFHSPYNCTAWNAFGPGTLIVTLEETEMVPVGIIAGGTVGSSILLLLFLMALALFLYRQRKGSRRGVTLGKPDIKVETVNKELEEESGGVSTATRMVKAMYSPFKDDVELKQELRVDGMDSREDYEPKDPTNGYYNVRATTHDDTRPQSRAVHYQGEFRPANANAAGGGGERGGERGGVGGASSGGGGGPSGAVPPSGVPGSRAGCYDPRPPSRMSHAGGYAPFNTFTRGAGGPGGPQSQQQQAPPPNNPPPQATPPGDFPGDFPLDGGGGGGGQMSYDGYGYSSAPYPAYRMGFAPPLAPPPPLEGGGGGPAYEMYPTGGQGAGPGAGQGAEPGGVGKYGSSASRFSYSSPPSEYTPAHRHTQRMQTHV